MNVRKDPSGYRTMWLFVFFDLPTLTPEQRKEHSRFRKRLERFGFIRAQFSVYIQCFNNLDSCDAMKRQITAVLPPGGEVRILSVTDRQFERMQVIQARKRIANESEPEIALLF
jgi:CRISPR-associated protein Cas2